MFGKRFGRGTDRSVGVENGEGRDYETRGPTKGFRTEKKKSKDLETEQKRRRVYLRRDK